MVGPENDEFMLDTDMCLAYQDNKPHRDCMAKNFNPKRSGDHKALKKCKHLEKSGVPLLAKNSNCCAWTYSGPFFMKKILNKGKSAFVGGENEYCGI